MNLKLKFNKFHGKILVFKNHMISGLRKRAGVIFLNFTGTKLKTFEKDYVIGMLPNGCLVFEFVKIKLFKHRYDLVVLAMNS